jgi:hypothetical protein
MCRNFLAGRGVSDELHPKILRVANMMRPVLDLYAMPLPPAKPKVRSTVWKPTAVALSLTTTVHPRKCPAEAAEQQHVLTVFPNEPMPGVARRY